MPIAKAYDIKTMSIYTILVYATREPPKMKQFDWFAIGMLGNIP